MDETMKNTIENEEEINGQMSLLEDEVVSDKPEETPIPQTNDELKAAIEAQLTKIRRQSILIGAQTACTVILEKIMVLLKKPGKISMNDYKRLVKEIQQFCETGISRKINADGEPEPITKEKSEDNSTKLMED